MIFLNWRTSCYEHLLLPGRPMLINMILPRCFSWASDRKKKKKRNLDEKAFTMHTSTWDIVNVSDQIKALENTIKELEKLKAT